MLDIITQYQDKLQMENTKNSVAVVIPCYKVKNKILSVIDRIPDLVERIYCIDDACPEKSGALITDNCKDPRIEVIYHEKNQGVGAATKSGYFAAIKDNMDIVVKIDGDGQMAPELISRFIQPILLGHADYTKGNRFFNLEDLSAMPRMRLLGNAGLSFLTKLSSGYWHSFDPTNGYTAIHIHTLREVPLRKISDRFFFESDMLFRLNTVGAIVQDIPMKAIYEDEVSNLKVGSSFFHFLGRNIKNFTKRVFYNYFLRDFNLASLQLLAGLLLMIFGTIFGVNQWMTSIQTGVTVSSGTVMLSALPIIIGSQFIIAFLSYDTRRQHHYPLFIRNLKTSLGTEMQSSKSEEI